MWLLCERRLLLQQFVFEGIWPDVPGARYNPVGLLPRDQLQVVGLPGLVRRERAWACADSEEKLQRNDMFEKWGNCFFWV